MKTSTTKIGDFNPNSHGLKNKKCLEKYFFVLERFPKKNVIFQRAFDEAQLMFFIEQIIRTAVKEPPPFSPNPPTVLCAGGGVVLALFGHKPWLWLWF
jgi:hypothetical protein